MDWREAVYSLYHATLVWPAPDAGAPKEVVRLEDGQMVTPMQLEVTGGNFL